MANGGRAQFGGLAMAAAALLCLAGAAPGVQVSTQLSPHNSERARRAQTLFIILHTTEAPERSAFNKLRERGECNYFISAAGRIYRIIEPGRLAYHAGLSMWQGRRQIDLYSVGIEMSGYYDRSLTRAQVTALAALLAELQARYGVPDERVLPHCAVAYGLPNEWHPRAHRGRKRCGMLFAGEALRRRLGLTDWPSFDPDVRAGRLVIGDSELQRALYGRRSALAPSQAPTAPAPAAPPSAVPAAPVPPPPAAPAPALSPRLVIGRGQSAWDVAGPAFRSRTTLYEFPDGRRKRGSEIRDWRSLPPGTKITLGVP